MRKPMFLTLIAALLLTGCGPTREEYEAAERQDRIEMVHAADWTIVQSPNTGLCYEVLVNQKWRQGYMAMSEVSCDNLPTPEQAAAVLF